jgi:hypothetical protein
MNFKAEDRKLNLFSALFIWSKTARIKKGSKRK